MKKVKVRIIDETQQTSSKLETLLSSDAKKYKELTIGKIVELWKEKCKYAKSCSGCNGYIYYLDKDKKLPLCGYAVEEIE